MSFQLRRFAIADHNVDRTQISQMRADLRRSACICVIRVLFFHQLLMRAHTHNDENALRLCIFALKAFLEQNADIADER
jgi:hypothetical protein